MNRLVIPALFVGLTIGCTNVPVSPLGDTFSVAVSVSQENSEAIQVDFLWVIDDSASMCQEQASLAQSFSEFIERITSFVNIDYRIAVVTTNMLSRDKVAKFRHHKTTEFPFACAENKIQACVRPEQLGSASQELKDLCLNGECDCSNLGDAWRCDAPDKAKNILNCNVANGDRTLNSKCRLTCTEAWECDAAFVDSAQGDVCKGDPNKCVYKCLNPSGNPENSGCVLRPESSTCPSDEELKNILIDAAGKTCDSGASCDDNRPCADGSECKAPTVPFLTPATAEQYFQCVGVVGAEQHNDANLEQGLNAAIWALHPNGPEENVAQARSFLRKDAYLVVVFVSDEDDCSTADCSWDPEEEFWRCGHRMKKEKYGTCTCLPDATQGGELRPVSEAVNMVKSLKNDPGRVLVAAIVGDSQASAVTDPEVVAQERADYLASKCGMCQDDTYQHPLLFNTYMCESAAGKADLGKRYIEFVNAFGANGILTNICSDEGVGPALSQIADRIIRVFTKVCLPREIRDDQSLVVRLVGPQGTCGDGSACCTVTSSECTEATACGDGSQCVPNEELIEEGDQPDTRTYRIEVSSDCDQTSDKKAIVFNSLLAPGTDLLIDYQAMTTPTVQQQ